MDWTKWYTGQANMGQWNPWWKGYASRWAPTTFAPDTVQWGAKPGDEASSKQAAQQQSFAWLLSTAIPWLAPGQAHQMYQAARSAVPGKLWEEYADPGMKEYGDYSGWGATEAKQKESTWMNFYNPERILDYKNYLGGLEAFDGVAEQPREAGLWLAMDKNVRNWIMNTLDLGAQWFGARSRDVRSELSDALSAAMGTQFGTDVIPADQLEAAKNMVLQIIQGGRRGNPMLNVGMTPFGYSGANQRYG